MGHTKGEQKIRIFSPGFPLDKKYKCDFSRQEGGENQQEPITCFVPYF